MFCMCFASSISPFHILHRKPLSHQYVSHVVFCNHKVWLLRSLKYFCLNLSCKASAHQRRGFTDDCIISAMFGPYFWQYISKLVIYVMIYCSKSTQGHTKWKWYQTIFWKNTYGVLIPIVTSILFCIATELLIGWFHIFSAHAINLSPSVSSHLAIHHNWMARFNSHTTWFILGHTFISINSLRPRQNGRLFADNTFKCLFLNENIRISTKISLCS